MGRQNAELGADNHRLAAAFEKRAQQGFALAVAVGAGGVVEVDTGIFSGGQGASESLRPTPPISEAQPKPSTEIFAARPSL
jgi:hypothetical protein